MSLVTFTLSIFEEKCPQRGEDAPLRQTYGDRAAMIACMDGCGGSGGRSYPQFGGWSGARIASRLIGNTLADWFQSADIGNCGTSHIPPEELAAQLQELLSARLKKVKADIPAQSSVVASRLSKTMPTTLASVLVEAEGKNHCRICSFWAGDSRTYYFPVSGLRQTSRDDIRSREDPFDSLINDGILSNVINADTDFRIRSSCTYTEEPCMVLTATDGCFSYFPSPMSLEEVLLRTLMEARCPLDWENALRKEIGAVAGDDYTLQLAVVGFSNFHALQTAYASRWEYFKREYADPMRQAFANNDPAQHRALWMTYKTTYMSEE